MDCGFCSNVDGLTSHFLLGLGNELEELVDWKSSLLDLGSYRRRAYLRRFGEGYEGHRGVLKMHLSLGKFPNLSTRHLIWTPFQLIRLIRCGLRNPHRPRNQPRLETPKNFNRPQKPQSTLQSVNTENISLQLGNTLSFYGAKGRLHTPRVSQN